MHEGRDRAVFADRDGTLIEDPGFLTDPDGVKLVPGAAEALADLRRRGFRLVVVSNQSGLARQLIRAEQATAVHERFVRELERYGVELDDVRYCPHLPEDGCACRKPLPGLLLDAASKLDVDLTRSFMVGDRDSDVEAGRRAGCTTILLSTDTGGPANPDHIAGDWTEVVRVIESSPS